MAREDKKRISESVEEVDQLLDDMATVSQQMREGKKLYTEEEIGEHAKNAVDGILDDIFDEITDEDIENFFYDPVYENITAEDTEEGVIITIDGRYIDGEDRASWLLTLDGTELPLEGEGKTLVLSEEDSAAYRAAASVTASVTIDRCDSGTFTLK